MAKNNYKFFQNKECEFFPCHKIANKDDFNCLFCYCPIYAMKDDCGGDFQILENGVKDCSACSLPHIKDNYQIIVDRVSVLVDRVKINDQNYKIRKLLFATSNKNKIKEFKKIFKKNNIKIYLLDDFPNIAAPKETGKTFKENSILKAKYYSRKTGLPTISEDSGLIIEKLDDFPGINSARWLSNESYDVKNKTIINMLKEKNASGSSAKYFCSLTFYDNKINFNRTFFGEWRGTIATKISGKNGFGYDPIFICDKNKQSAGELDNEIKNKISHRYKAVIGFISWLNYFS